MGWTRQMGATVSLAVLASVVANYAIHRQFERRFEQTAASLSPQAEPGALIFEVPPAAQPEDTVASAAPRCLDPFMDDHRPLGSIQTALQTTEADEAGRKGTPDPVPVPNDAVPITEDDPAPPAAPAGSPAVRRVIEDELAGSSREERDIWFEELKSLPAGVVRDLLQVRKQLRALPRGLHRMDPVVPAEPLEAVQSVPAPRVAALPAEPISQARRQPLPDWLPTMAAIEQACSIARHNLANSATPGFKRLRATLVDAYGTPWQTEGPEAVGTQQPARLNPPQVDGCRLGNVLLDLKAGSLHQTDRQFDLAIDGEGFFVATLNEQSVYTRCGAMVLDSQRRICLAVGERSAVVEPGIVIPADAREVQISGDGTVMILSKPATDPVAIGRLAIARFASPSRLRPAGGTLLMPTEASGEAELGLADEGGRGAIQQGCLEQSNVDPEEELAEIDQWQSLLKSFPAVSRPVTASGQEPGSR